MGIDSSHRFLVFYVVHRYHSGVMAISDELRKMKVGESRTFDFPDAKKVHSAAVMTYRLGKFENIHFACRVDFAGRKLTVTRRDDED